MKKQELENVFSHIAAFVSASGLTQSLLAHLHSSIDDIEVTTKGYDEIASLFHSYNEW